MKNIESVLVLKCTFICFLFDSQKNVNCFFYFLKMWNCSTLGLGPNAKTRAPKLHKQKRPKLKLDKFSSAKNESGEIWKCRKIQLNLIYHQIYHQITCGRNNPYNLPYQSIFLCNGIRWPLFSYLLIFVSRIQPTFSTNQFVVFSWCALVTS